MHEHATLRTSTNRYPVPVTASWSTRLPDGYARIGVSRGPPRGQRGYRMYTALAPGSWFRSVTDTEFRDLYLTQLHKLDASRVVADLTELAAGHVPALLCFERPPPDPAWCHRGLISAWLFDALRIEVVEFGHANSGGGWAHPKLPQCCKSPGDARR
jgi:hypothetical protein